MNFWDERYRDYKQAYGDSPNVFLKKFLKSQNIECKKVLFPGEGQGRNSSYACTLGAEVTCFYSSEEAIKQSRELYERQSQKIKYDFSFYGEYKTNVKFDYICLIFCHCDIETQRIFFKNITSLLSENGILYILGYSKKQIEENTGGPKKSEMLYDYDLENQLSLNLISKNNFTTELVEGSFHNGKSHLIELVLKK